MSYFNVCPRCGQVNEPARYWCWVCSRILSDPATREDYRQLLRVREGATPVELRAAYDLRTLHWQSATGAAMMDDARMKVLEQAYETLGHGRSPAEAGHFLLPRLFWLKAALNSGLRVMGAVAGVLLTIVTLHGLVWVIYR